MKLFQTGSAAVVIKCQKQIIFLPLKYQVDIRTASFMLRFIATENSIYNLFDLQVTRSLQPFYMLVTETVNSISSLKAAVLRQFYDI
jgi:hypothetical protein